MDQKNHDLRQYSRLKSVFPVDFTLIHIQDELLGLDWTRGYTCNVCRTGLCLQTSALRSSAINFLKKEGIQLELRIGIPIGKTPFRVVAKVAWYKIEEIQDYSNTYIGLEFTSITDENLNRMLRHAKYFGISARIVIIISAIIFIGLIIIGLINYF